MTDPYAVLEVPRDAPADEIRRAYKRLARTWHPDRNRDPQAAERFREIAAAWAILGDPQRRFGHDGRAADAGAAEEYIDQVASAIERAQTYIERVVLPHYGSRFRGSGLAAVVELLRDAPKLTDPRWLVPRIGWRGRRRARAWAEAIGVAFGSGWEPTDLLRHRTGWTVRVSPRGLWAAGLREPTALDDAVLGLLLIRYAQVLGGGRVYGPPAATDAAWDQVLAAARQRDDEVVRSRRSTTALWVGVAAILAFMLYAGFTNL